MLLGMFVSFFVTTVWFELIDCCPSHIIHTHTHTIFAPFTLNASGPCGPDGNRPQSCLTHETADSRQHFECLTFSSRLLRLMADTLYHACRTPGICLQVLYSYSHIVINHLSSSQHNHICLMYAPFVSLTVMLYHELGWRLVLDLNQVWKNLSDHQTLLLVVGIQVVFFFLSLLILYPWLSPHGPD